VVSFSDKPLPFSLPSVSRPMLSTEDPMRSRRTIAIAALSAANVRSFARPSDWLCTRVLCTRVLGHGYSSQTNTKPEQGLPKPE
jgi:hypothetical protein